MRHLLAMALFVCVTPALAAEPSHDVETALRQLNEAFTTHNSAAITSLMTENHTAITPWAGKQTREEQVATLGDLELDEYTAGAMTFTPVGDDGVLVGYSLKMAGTFRGTPLAPHSFVTAVWVKADGQWKELLYQETAVAP